MKRRIYIGVAWPYANSPLHLGHIAGAYLPPDIFARYNRMKGNPVLLVTGSDMHGTPITITAEREGVTPAEVAEKYHRSFLECWEKLGITFDLFTHTSTANHATVAKDIFLKLYNQGDIYKDSVLQPWCSHCKRYLPDRYVEGDCPLCGYDSARGDQCDKCGQPLNPIELKKPRCGLCATAPEFKESEHFFLRLSAFQERLINWVKTKENLWRPNVYRFTLSYLEKGLKDRAITRDIDWGVELPLEGYPGKRIYVWFEAVIGYLSASIEWAQRVGEPEKWREFWQDESVRSYYFIGKDNIPFHTIIWPAILMGYGGLNLPYDVPANEYLTIEGQKLSSSRNWAVWLPDYLSRYDPDPLRYLLSVNMPETSDTDFSWREYVRRNNDELVATYGNLVQRVLTMTYRNFDCSVPEPGEFDSEDRALLEKAEKAFEHVDNMLEACRFREAIRTVMTLAGDGNRYLEEKSPWKVIKQDRQKAATSLYVALSVINTLKILMYPFLPFSSQKLHEYLGYSGKIEEQGWKVEDLPPGQELVSPQPLFVKLDDSVVEEETARLGK
ncbi:MAG: methionine--tRNA ligase [Dehalococcoidales bacterium]|nr:methionine--tRNA ligase [Dehalococcoidales bacterium]